MKFRRDLFMRACFMEDVSMFFEGLRGEFDEQQIQQMRQKFHVSRICRACGKPIREEDFDVFVGYFVPVWFPIHRSCLAAHQRYEYMECQKIDMNCNDCVFLHRADRRDPGGCLFGWCGRKGVGVSFLPRVCVPKNFGCFVHRKEG